MNVGTRHAAMFAALLSFALPTTAIAQSPQFCSDLLPVLLENHSSFACADAGYFADGADGEPGQDLFSDNRVGIGEADLDGYLLFDPDDPEKAAPDNLVPPFGSRVLIDNSRNDEIVISHRGSASMTPRDSDSQSLEFGSFARTKVVPIAIDGKPGSVTIDMQRLFDFILGDPRENDTTGHAEYGAGFFLGEENGNVLSQDSGFARVDVDFEPDIFLQGNFDNSGTFFTFLDKDEDLINFTRTESESFDVTPGEPLILDSGNFGSIFTDGFESGDTAAWTSSSPSTFDIRLSTDDPNVRLQLVTEPEINAGMNDAWVSADAPFQGLFFTIFPGSKLFFLAWFTFDSVLPGIGAPAAVFGANDHRWVTGAGFYNGNKVTINVELTSGGIFNDDDPAASQQKNYGTITIEFINCNEALLTYDFPSVGLSGTMTLTRVLTDNVKLCQELAGP